MDTILKGLYLAPSRNAFSSFIQQHLTKLTLCSGDYAFFAYFVINRFIIVRSVYKHNVHVLVFIYTYIMWCLSKHRQRKLWPNCQMLLVFWDSLNDMKIQYTVPYIPRLGASGRISVVRDSSGSGTSLVVAGWTTRMWQHQKYQSHEQQETYEYQHKLVVY